MQILESFFAANRCVTREYDGIELEVAGEIPAGIKGTLFRNGNGRFVHQGVRYDHLFDGDGMVTAFAFDGRGGVTYRNRYVRTREFVAEEEAGRMLYRSFGTNLPGGFARNFLKMQFKNAANTSVVWHGGRLLALWEGGWPHEIDPQTLATRSRFSYDGVLENKFSWLDQRITPELPFSAHPKEHPATGLLYNFGTAAGTQQRLVLYQVQPDGEAAITHAIPMEALSFTHDFVLTEGGRQVFFLTPVAFDIWKAFLGLAPPVAVIRQNKQQAVRILVVDGDKIERYETDFCFAFHFTNGFETDAHTIVADALVMADFPGADATRDFLDGDDAGTPVAHLMRFTIDRKTGAVTRERLSDHAAELPATHPDRTGRPYRYAWTVGAPPDAPHQLLTGINKIDTHERRTQYLDLFPSLPGEPLFVPRPGAAAEDDGWLLTLIFETEKTETQLRIYEAATLREVARAKLPHNIPLGFHGQFVVGL